MSDLENMLPDIAEAIDVDTGMDATLVVYGHKQLDPLTREVLQVAETSYAVKITPPSVMKDIKEGATNTRSECMIGPDVKVSIGDSITYDSVKYSVVESSPVRVPGGDIGAYQLVLEG